MSVSLTFQIYRGDELVGEETLSQDVIKVGKLPSSHLRLDDDDVSRMHAVIEVGGPDAIYVVDLGSASGTLVNGEKVNKQKIGDGDTLQFGGLKVVVSVGAVEDAPVAAPPAGAGVAPPPPVPPAMGSAAAGGALGEGPFADGGAPPIPSPFGDSPTAAAVAPEVEDPDSVMYGIVANGPPVRAEDVETSDQALEIMVMWGDRAVLNVDHLSPPRSYYLGDKIDKKGRPDGVDFLIGSEVVGGERVPLVLADDGAAPSVVVPAGAEGELTVGDQVETLDDLRAANRLVPSSELPGASQIAIPPNGTLRFQHNDFTFLVRTTNAGRALAGASKIDPKPLTYVGSSMAIFAAFLVMFYFLPPSPSSLSLDAIDTNSRLVQYLMEPPETQEEELPDWLQNNQDDDEGGKGKRHKDDEGQMGKKDNKKTKNKYAIEGPSDNEDPQMAREQAREEARNAGVLGALSQTMGAFNSPTSPFGADAALGVDPMSALGAM